LARNHWPAHTLAVFDMARKICREAAAECNKAAVSNAIGALAEEIDFLMSGQRVELNAMTSDQLIEVVEGKLAEHGIRKVVPAKDRLDKAFRLFARTKVVEEAVEKVIVAMPADTIAVPEDLDARVRDYLDENPKSPWEAAVRHVVLEIKCEP
jgi:hypothetical protein